MRSGTGATVGASYLPSVATGAKRKGDRETGTIGRLGTDDPAIAARLDTQLGGREASSGQSLGVALSVRRGSHRGGPQRDPSPPAPHRQPPPALPGLAGRRSKGVAPPGPRSGQPGARGPPGGRDQSPLAGS